MTDSVVDPVTVTSFLLKLRQVTDWYMLGVYLDLPPYELDKIRHIFHNEGVERCKVALFDLWTRTKPKYSWEGLSGALEKCENVALSVKILEQHVVVGVGCDGKVGTSDSEKPQNADDCVKLELQKTQVKTFCKLEREFAGIATDLESVLEKKEVPLKILRRFLEERLDQKGAYQKATTIDELLLMVSPHYSFFNTSLLEDLIEMFIGQPLKQRLEDFEEGLEKFTKMTKMSILTMIEAQHPAANITALPKVVLKLNGRWLNVTIQRFQELVQHIFGERSRSLSHICVEDGCICVTWCTCASAVPFLVSAAEQKVMFMMYIGVLRLSVGSTTVFEQKSSQLGDSLSADLMRAVSDGCVEATDFLVNPDPNYREANDHTLLTAACINGSLSTVKVLLEAKADPNLPDSRGYTPLMLASSRGLETIVALLLHWGADPNLQTSSGTTALLSADYNDNHVSLFNSLLIAGASVDAQDNAGWSSLMFACSRGCAEIVRLLLQHNANVNLCTFGGATALMFACVLCISTRLKLLKEDVSSSVAIEKSISAKLTYKSCVDTCLHLLDSSADPNRKDRNGQTSLMFVAAWQQAELVQHLLVHGADPNLADTLIGWNSLMYSCAIKDTTVPDPSIPILLLSAGADPNHRNGQNATALALAAYHEYESAVTCLLNTGVDVNAEDLFGNTALHFSAQTGNVAITELLLTAGANISVINQRGETPLDMAIASCNQAVTQHLLASMETDQLLAPETTPYRQPVSISEQIHEAVLHPLEPTGTTKLEEKHKKPTDTKDMN